MIRLLYIGDVHYRGNSPRARLDSYPDAIKAKLRECWSLAAQNNCQAVICPGDLLDSPDPDYSVTGELAAVLRECPVPFYTCIGNHEIYGYSQSTVPRTALGLLARIGAVKLLTRVPVVIDDAANSVYLTGQGYHADMDRSQADYQTGLSTELCGWRVHVVHGMLVEKPLPYEAPHTLVKDLKSDADVVLAGHEHIGFGYLRSKNNAACINPGALGRVNAKIEEMYRPIQVALLTFTSDCQPITVDLIPLSCARPGSEVLSREHIEQQIQREDRTSRFLSLLASEGESRFLEVADIVDDIARRDALPVAVTQDALRRIGLARELLGRSA
jgi:exonuclease SbcD